MDVLLILQGGGSLGAYECGVYQALAPWLRAERHKLLAVCGTSIGAMNASVIAARHGDPDHGVAALDGLWRSLGENSARFLPPLQALESVNAVWTSLLLGNPRLFRPTVPFWTFMPPVTWAPFSAFYDTSPLEATLTEFFTNLGPKYVDPRLILTAVNLATERVDIFDSFDTSITPRHVLASCSLPPSFPATDLAGTSYWDGGLWSNTPLREALNALQKPGSPGPQPLGECIAILVELFAPPARAPGPIAGNWDVWARRDRIIFQNKGEYDEKAAGAFNRHIDFVNETRKLLDRIGPAENDAVKELSDHVNAEFKTLETERRLHLIVRRIVRSSDGTADIGREIDFSPERIDVLVRQGRHDAEQMIQSS
jgi:predicted acylesterase/phospholipase RssA